MAEKPESWDVNMMPCCKRWSDKKPLAAKVEQTCHCPTQWMIGNTSREILYIFRRPSTPPSRRVSTSTLKGSVAPGQFRCPVFCLDLDAVFFSRGNG
ncbi:hypothetical protein PISMIDRAFT_676425 [Pisolithus microcarpus 441]|uniref:Uncharacterized protein n=1 Tax=Pisolithus microcarpus 441 TaxID=765257 RepID=A0A0D0A1G4_9AGAM|nr:hypothetical protein PISMIDRAFT_676425 [Pisolithus microcarpus 441]